ncbi:hypothetical protein JHK85_004314 [Glycine max]|nr:hypothetical protein JHK85_004314 [Glycine max]
MVARCECEEAKEPSIQAFHPRCLLRTLLTSICNGTLADTRRQAQSTLELIKDSSESQHVADGVKPLLMLPVMKLAQGVIVLIIEVVQGVTKKSGNGPTTPSTAPVGSPSGSSAESPEGSIIPSASDFPSGAGSKTVPSIDGGSSDGNAIKVPSHLELSTISSKGFRDKELDDA